MRLIDANALLDKQESLYTKGHVLFHGVTAYAIENAPTIDPETLPIVRHLREKLKNEIAKKEICGETIERLDKQLEKVTAERDAAVKNRAELADFELSACEGFCFGDARHDIPPCEWVVSGKCKLREWREVKPDGFCNEFKPEEKEK